MDVQWSEGHWFPTFVKGGAFGFAGGDPVYAGGMTQPWRETELAWRFDRDVGDWTPAPPMLLGRCYTRGTTTTRGLAVVSGRKAGRRSLADAWLLTGERDALAWEKLPDIRQPRAECGLSAAGNVVVAAGGGVWETKYGGAFTGDGVLTSERLDLANLAAGWRDTATPPFRPRSSFSAAPVGSDIWFAGGYNCRVDADGKREFDYFGDVWRYDTESDTWTEAPPLPFRMSGHDMVAVDDRYLVLVGGCVRQEIDGQLVLHHTLFVDEKRKLVVGEYSNFAWCYDTRTGECTLLPGKMPHGLNDLRAITDGQRIYVLGGENVDPSTSNTTERFMIGDIQR